ncbi:hypothetical protein TNCT_429071 [Trichonephila clavata]|uniref:Uncharacterized protein n=1 Tax=Trichonephila clavata TaxID=2740835 RepID=A0A8X6LPW2_TRICU|nr:hypothetical protein TNCT_429071 [Trichonephila clavata]
MGGGRKFFHNAEDILSLSSAKAEEGLAGLAAGRLIILSLMDVGEKEEVNSKKLVPENFKHLRRNSFGLHDYAYRMGSQKITNDCYAD